MDNTVRVRFAPSPTGPLHIGGLRTALFNYLFAKKYKGVFVLRIEDTDKLRYIANAEQYIVNSLEWCNIYFDEGPGKNEKYGPYRQSERSDIYKKFADKLLKKGWAYYAFDSTEQLNTLRKDCENKGQTFMYNVHNRNKLNNSLALTKQQVQAKLATKEKYVVRFKVPHDELLIIEDEIRGTIKVSTNNLDDKILLKSDGNPTYHLASVVDDYLMKISHVIRGEEWLPSLAIHNLLYKAFGWNAPKFAHLPLILKPVGKGKLSKRDGDEMGFPVFPLTYKNDQTGECAIGYKESGYFSDAFINMLVLLGWNPGTDRELFSLTELIETFSLNRVNKTGSKFSPDKAKWFNQQYLQLKSDAELANLFLPILEQKGIKKEFSYIEKVVALLKQRTCFIADFWSLGSFFFKTPTKFDSKAIKKQWKEDSSTIIQELVAVVDKVNDFSSENIEVQVKNWIELKKLSFSKVTQPLRLCLVGALKGPNIFDIMELIGKQASIARMKYAIANI
ncbi:MAG: glutamate--tRNA ligase [Tenacibaculum sp.]